MHLILAHDGLERGEFDDLMPLWLRVITPERLLTTGTLLGLERDHHVHLFYRQQLACLPWMTGLSSWTSSTGLATRPLAFRRITRRRTRRGARVLLQAFHQFPHGCLERRHTGFKR